MSIPLPVQQNLLLSNPYLITNFFTLSMTQIETSNAKCSFIWKYKRSYTKKSQSNATNNETILKFPTEVKVKKKY